VIGKDGEAEQKPKKIGHEIAPVEGLYRFAEFIG